MGIKKNKNSEIRLRAPFVVSVFRSSHGPKPSVHESHLLPRRKTKLISTGTARLSRGGTGFERERLGRINIETTSSITINEKRILPFCTFGFLDVLIIIFGNHHAGKRNQPLLYCGPFSRNSDARTPSVGGVCEKRVPRPYRRRKVRKN